LKVKRYISKTEDETLKIGAEIGSYLKPGYVLLISGEIGAGKTILTKGIALALGVTDAEIEVVSPTFTILNTYKGRCNLFHFDFYRLKYADYELSQEISEIIENGGIAVIEWGERFKEMLPCKAMRAEIKIFNEGLREIIFYEG